MTSMNDKTKRRVLKMLALAERGCDGEKETAARMLARILEKHGMTLDDLDTLDIEWVRFDYNNQMERELLVNIISMVLAKHEFKTARFEDKKMLEVEASKPDAVEIEILFDVYLKAFLVECGKLLPAFIIKHQIGFEDDHGPVKTMTWAERVRLGHQMDAMAHVNKPHKRIN